MEVSFGVLKHLLKKKDLIAVFENRLKLGYKTYSIINHAELVNIINPADGDPWDLVIPGYGYSLCLHKTFNVQEVKKVLFVEGGNHKIFIRVNVPGYQEDLAERQMNEFKRDYERLNGLKTHWVFI